MLIEMRKATFSAAREVIMKQRAVLDGKFLCLTKGDTMNGLYMTLPVILGSDPHSAHGIISR